MKLETRFRRHNPRLPRRPLRAGFTLLELLLASVAAAMLLSALYMALNITVSQTQRARDASGTEDLVRGVFNRMAVDINGTLGMLPPSSGGQSSIQNMNLSITTPPGSQTQSTSGSTTGSGGSTGSGSSGGMSGSSGSSNSSSSSSSSSSSTSSSSGASILGLAYVNPEIGVVGGYQGNTNMLILFVSKVPDVFTTTDANSLAQLYGQGSASSTVQFPADLRRIVYWLGGNGGLYRHETPWVTGVESWNLMDLPMPDESGVLIAKEVAALLFEYYDPFEQGWEQSWDGTGSSSPPYSLMPGPPSAIRVTLTFKFENPKGGDPIQSMTSQTFPIYPAGGTNPEVPQLVLYDPTIGSGSTSSSSGSGSGSGNSSGSGP